jgi:predicted DNA-binding protein with PD1-like motif
MAMRSIRHPGPVAPVRERVAAGTAVPLVLRLRAGQSVNAAVTGALAEAGCASGYVDLDGLAIAPMHYVIPAASPDTSHAAWYSDTHSPAGIVTVERAGVIAGIRDGEPFIHCHGVWHESDGERRAGHLLPHEAIVARDTEVQGWGLSGAAFVARDDAETNFKLFSAEAAGGTGAPPSSARALACTMRPNGDISAAIERVCQSHGFLNASVFGVGSLVGVDFADGSHVASYATEVIVRRGTVVEGRCELDVALVDMNGDIHEGLLVRGSNPVCVTFELVIVEE